MEEFIWAEVRSLGNPLIHSAHFNLEPPKFHSYTC